MRPFAYSRPDSITEAIALLAPDGQAAGQSRALAGGTDLLTLMKADIAAPARLVDIRRLAEIPDTIEATAQGLTLGGRVTLSEIERHPEINARYRALAEAAALAATPQLRNMATIAGNLQQRPRCWYFRNASIPCWLKGGDHCPAHDGQNEHHALFGGGPCYAVHPSDPATALLMLDAEARLCGPGGERTLPLRELFALPTDARRTETVVAPDELILSLTVPPLPDGTRSTYLKAMNRKVWAFALVGVAAALRIEDGRIVEARLALSGVAPIPWRVPTAEHVLLGAVPDAAHFAHAAEAALADATPLAHNAYKVPLAKHLIARALAEVAAPASVSTSSRATGSAGGINPPAQ